MTHPCPDSHNCSGRRLRLHRALLEASEAAVVAGWGSRSSIGSSSCRRQYEPSQAGGGLATATRQCAARRYTCGEIDTSRAERRTYTLTSLGGERYACDKLDTHCDSGDRGRVVPLSQLIIEASASAPLRRSHCGCGLELRQRIHCLPRLECRASVLNSRCRHRDAACPSLPMLHRQDAHMASGVAYQSRAW